MLPNLVEMSPAIQEVKQSYINLLGRPFTPLEEVIFDLYGNDIDCNVWVEYGNLKYSIGDKINFVK